MTDVPASARPAPERPDADVLDRDGPAIEVRGLRTQFGDHVVHEDLDLTVRRGEILGVVGGSGTGKSVLLNTIIGLRSPNAGTVTVLGQELQRASRRRWSALERSWGVLFQGGALFSNLTVRENVTAPMFEHSRLSRREADELADLKIAMVGLRPEAGSLKPAELSGGMKKRAGLARALALDPELLFLDEPTSGLDPIGAAAFDELTRDLSNSLGLTVFMITHDLDSLYAITDRVAVLADRKVVATAPVGELESSDHPWIREYFLGPRGRAARSARNERA
ncbi:ABC transporter ATP-binding protein [Phenylobacterium sp. SCN 70-31]|uniref:ABC transporter ATP-binding protein n=1 Tax=Phenylobacterium sp. SCN 70-31 TaxID=1660129 RepID=UPI00086927D1|nr:ABC transporter ATP-binding protein [Phenylobacterium sp. SCN 70-31]ODT89571.1 MAG: ABC transporter ATP-binding protein [Phenylobacterium sp. SCN 70-31]